MIQLLKLNILKKSYNQRRIIMEMTISMELAKKALTEEELQNLKTIYDKVEAYKEKLKLKKGDKLKRKRDGKIFTYVDRAPCPST